MKYVIETLEQAELSTCSIIPVSHPIDSTLRNSFTNTDIARIDEGSRHEGSDDHEGDNSLDKSGYVSHLGFDCFLRESYVIL
jgi:hypothetical protein